MEKRKPPAETQLADLYRLPLGTIRLLRQRGCDIYDARDVVKFLKRTARKPSEWKDFFEEGDDSHEYWKREKTKQEVEGLRLKNAKVSGEMFDKLDGESVQDAWAAALKIKLAERRATYPQLMAGKAEAWIADFVESEDRKMLEELSDLESGLWEQVFEKYASVEGTPADVAEGGNVEAASKTKRKRVVRSKRESGSGVDS